jgi:signal transduction histidine kinase
VGQSAGLIRIRGDEHTVYADDPALLNGVRALYESRDGTLWTGTTNGLSRREGDRFRTVAPGELVNIRSILEDEPTGRLWVGTQRGLARIDGESVTWLTAQDGLSPGSVRTLHMDAEGILWVGTYGGGLSRIEGETITRYSQANGLANDFLACILEDEQERLWINSNKGPFVVHREDLNRVARGDSDRVACVLFTRAEGAREANGGNQPSGWLAPDGRMWFPSIEGVTVADPRLLPVVEEPPSVLIEALDVGAERELYARFTALGFSAPERVRVQYRLLGNGSDWIECVGPREARYSYLKPGEYELEVRAKNGFGAWSDVESRRFEIEAELHETPAFLVGVVLVIGLGAFGFAELRIRKARERAERLERLHAERDRAERALSQSQAVLSRLSRGLLVTQESERRRISSELHDDVTQRIAALAIQAEIVEARLDSGSEHTREQLQGIVTMAQQLAGDVQQLSRRLHPVGLRTLGLSEAIRQECAAFTRRSGVEVEVTEDVASDEVPEDLAVAAFRILQESLHNIEKHAQASEVSVGIEIESGELLLCVRDSGTGFDSERGPETGLGLVTMHERAASIGGKLSVVSRPGEGTEVCLRAPGPGSHA